MPRYSSHNLRLPHDIHFSWTGWPSGSEFPTAPPAGLIEELRVALAPDGLDLESHSWRAEQIQLTVAADPGCAPVWVAQRVKGRLDHALRQQGVKARFSRKVSVRAVGHNRTQVVDQYVRDQLQHVDLADPKYRQTLASVAVNDASVDLSEPAETSSGRYWYGLHLVFVVASRYRIGNRDGLEKLRERVMEVSGRESCSLKRVAIMPDHMHVALRGNPRLSPTEIGLEIQEATADVAGCRMWEDEFYVGTFGDYDYKAIKGVTGGIRR